MGTWALCWITLRSPAPRLLSLRACFCWVRDLQRSPCSSHGAAKKARRQPERSALHSEGGRSGSNNPGLPPFPFLGPLLGFVEARKDCLPAPGVPVRRSPHKTGCHPERTGPQTMFSLGVVSRRICFCSSQNFRLTALGNEPVPLLFGEWNDGEPSDQDERRLREQRLCLDFGKSPGVLEALADLHLDNRNLGIAGIDAHHRTGSDSGAFIPGVIEDPLRPGLQFTQMLDCRRVGDAVPSGFLVALEVVEGVDAGLGLEEEVFHGSNGNRASGRGVDPLHISCAAT